MNTYENKSEVGCLLQQIDKAYEAAHQALYGLAAGMARHDFIQVKLGYLYQKGGQIIELVDREAKPQY